MGHKALNIYHVLVQPPHFTRRASGAAAAHGPGWFPDPPSNIGLQYTVQILHTKLCRSIAREAQEGTRSHSAGVVPELPGITPLVGAWGMVTNTRDT